MTLYNHTWYPMVPKVLFSKSARYKVFKAILDPKVTAYGKKGTFRRSILKMVKYKKFFTQNADDMRIRPQTLNFEAVGVRQTGVDFFDLVAPSLFRIIHRRNMVLYHLNSC